MKNKIKEIIFIFFLSINLQADLIGIPGEIIAIKLPQKTVKNFFSHSNYLLFLKLGFKPSFKSRGIWHTLIYLLL